MSIRQQSRRPSRPAPQAPGEALLARFLDPIDLLSEAIYSVLILLTFTLAFRALSVAGQVEPPSSAIYATEFVVAAVGAILAWGLIDGLMYMLLEMFQRRERYRFLQEVQQAESEQAGITIVAEELDYILEPITSEEDRQVVYRYLLQHLRQGYPRPVGLQAADALGALGSVVVALVAVFPSLLPLVLLRGQFDLALRLSNLISFGMLFVFGYRWGVYTGANPWKTGLLVMTLAVVMVAIAIPLGG